MTRLSILLAMSLLVASCGVLSPTQRSQAAAQVEAEFEAGNITRSQRDAAIEKLEKDEPFDWELLGVVGLNIALALVGGPMIVRRQRGAPTQKVGLPAALVHEEPPIKRGVS